MSDKYVWLAYVGLAGLAWGTYVPIIFYGGNELSARPGTSGRFMAILCVGGAYFVIGVLLPLLMFATGWLGAKWDDVNLGSSGLTFASLAGVAGAVGAIFVVFATTAAIASARQAGLPIDTYKIFIAPLIFGLAPVVNVLVSMVWHPQKGDPWHFGLKSTHWLLWVGILFVGVGAGLVLYSKELIEEAEKKAHPVAAKPAETAQPAPEGKTVSPAEAMDRLNIILAHAWMVRNFLKHADEVQEDEELLEVHRTIFDCIRAVEPSAQRQDVKEYLHRMRGKLSKLRKAAEVLAANYRRVSVHTNFEMASLSLTGCVQHIEEILATVTAPKD